METTATTNYPFPFIGAGDAAYYEWCEVTIRFRRAPTRDEKKRIAAAAPEPIKPKVADFSGRMIFAGGGQFINMYIQVAYGSEDELPESDDDSELDAEFFVTPEAQKAFNDDIERWLLAAHAICPVEIAFRREDGEAGGTELSAWHKESKKALPALLKSWAAEPVESLKEEELQDIQRLVQGLLEYSGRYKPTAEFLQKYDPVAYAESLIKEEQWDELAAHYQRNAANEMVLYELKEAVADYFEANRKKEAAIYALSKALLTVDAKPATSVYPQMLAAFNAQKDEDAAAQLLKRMATADFYDDVITALSSYNYYQHQATKNWAPGIQMTLQMFGLLKERKPAYEEDLSRYCNALYISQEDNTGIKMDPADIHMLLDMCLPHAPANPAIFFNAACNYAELGEYDAALAQVKAAIEHKYDNIPFMIKEINNGAWFAGFRVQPAVKEFLSKYKAENK